MRTIYNAFIGLTNGYAYVKAMMPMHSINAHREKNEKLDSNRLFETPVF